MDSEATIRMVRHAAGWRGFVHKALNQGREEFFARGEAACFRGRGEPIYPGVVLAIRAGSFHMHPVEDDRVHPTEERIMGNSIWGALGRIPASSFRSHCPPSSPGG